MASEQSTDEVEHGERYAYSGLTATWYLVTAWVEKGDGKIQARSKEKVDREEVPDDILDATNEVFNDG